MSAAPLDVKHPVVLLVGADLAAWRETRHALERDGVEVLEAGDEAGAFRQLRTRRIDLVVVDGANGDAAALAEELRPTLEECDAACIAAVCPEDAEQLSRAEAAGARDFLAKPLHAPLLAARVRALLRSQRGERALRRSESRLQKVQRMAALGDWQLDLRTGRLEVSSELQRLYDVGTPTPERFLERVHPEDVGAVRDALISVVQSGVTTQLEHRLRSPGIDDPRVFCVSAELVRDEDGEPSALVGSSQDVTRLRRAEERIRFLAFHDGLTRLANRRLFRERLTHALAHSDRNRDPVALLFLDLDHFKRINDTLGHTVGDRLLQRVADRLGHCVRATDCVSRDGSVGPSTESMEPGCTISRFGGDEFMMLLNPLRNPRDAAVVAKRVLDALSQPFSLDGREVVVSASIGITIAPEDGSDSETLFRNADTAMHHAKQTGRNHFRFYQSSMNEQARRLLELEGALRHAIAHAELDVAYQPKLDVATQRITGFEALVRWNHPSLGVIPPNDFVPIAEQAGLIGPLGELVLRQACAQARSWRDAGLASGRIAVNLSPHQFGTEEIAETVENVLRDTPLPAGLLDLEITESALMENEDTAIATLRRLKTMGIGLSLDDFGTGYSSLSYLRRFPVDAVKIDRSFVRHIGEDQDDQAITATIISMGRSLRLRVVAEGVETEQQLAFLKEHRCDEMQGFLFSPPVKPERATELLRRGRLP